MQAADTGISNRERACLSGGLANHLKYVQHLAFLEGQVLGQISRSSQTESRCWVMCCFNINDIHVINPDAQLIACCANGSKYGPCPVVT